MKYELYRGRMLLGVVVHNADDFPLHKGSFHPSKNFDTVASLFKQEVFHLEAGKMEDWQKIRDEIDRPGLELRPHESGIKTIVNPVIHIDGSEVWWS